MWTFDRQPNGDVKLVNSKMPPGDNLIVGRVLVYLNETWGTVDTSGVSNIIGLGQAVCRQLQFYDAFSAGTVDFYGWVMIYTFTL